jgi:hypothetical protein
MCNVGQEARFSLAYFIFAIINTIITLPVFVQNIFVVHFYIKEFKKFVPCMYLLIAISDCLTAAFTIIVSGLIMSVYSTMSSEVEELPDETCYGLIVSTAGWEVFYRVSVFVNLLLSVARTIKVKSPFFQIKMKVAVTSVSVYFVLWMAVALVDIVRGKPSSSLTYVKEGKLGLTIGGIVMNAYNDKENGTFYGATTMLILIIIPFIIPAILSCVCLVVMVRSLSKPPPSEQSAATQRHVTMTVTYLTLVFCICNSVSTLYFLFSEYVYELYLKKRPIPGDVSLTILFSLTLPLLNAAISPFIIITRSSSIANRVKQFFKIKFWG